MGIVSNSWEGMRVFGVQMALKKLPESLGQRFPRAEYRE